MNGEQTFTVKHVAPDGTERLYAGLTQVVLEYGESPALLKGEEPESRRSVVVYWGPVIMADPTVGRMGMSFVNGKVFVMNSEGKTVQVHRLEVNANGIPV